MADVPGPVLFTRQTPARRLLDYSWTQNARQETPAVYVSRAPLIRNIPAPRRLLDYGWTCNLVTTTLFQPNGVPFTGLAEQAPIGPRRAREYGWSVVNLLENTLAPADVDPFRSQDFMPPRGPRRAKDYGWAVNLLQTTLKPAPESIVFREAVVTRTPAARRARDYGWIGGNILLLGEPLFPVEWDPPPPARRLGDYGWTLSPGPMRFPAEIVVVPPDVPAPPLPGSSGGASGGGRQTGPLHVDVSRWTRRGTAIRVAALPIEGRRQAPTVYARAIKSGPLYEHQLSALPVPSVERPSVAAATVKILPLRVAAVAIDQSLVEAAGPCTVTTERQDLADVLAIIELINEFDEDE